MISRTRCGEIEGGRKRKLEVSRRAGEGPLSLAASNHVLWWSASAAMFVSLVEFNCCHFSRLLREVVITSEMSRIEIPSCIQATLHT